MVRSASVVAVTVGGELDIVTESALVDRIGALVDDGALVNELTLDLKRLRFCDSAGINALVQLRKVATQRGWRFALVHPQPAVRRVLELTGLGAYLNLERESTI